MTPAEQFRFPRLATRGASTSVQSACPETMPGRSMLGESAREGLMVEASHRRTPHGRAPDDAVTARRVQSDAVFLQNNSASQTPATEARSGGFAARRCSRVGMSPEMPDRLADQIIGSSLAIASILSLPNIDAEVVGRLRDVLEQLDAAIVDIRSRARSESAHRVSASRPRLRVVATPAEPLFDTPPGNDVLRRRLYGFDVDVVYAYATHGHDFYRVADNLLWAHESEDLLLSARSGRPIARRTGDVFYDIDSDTPLYYERA
jgi:hypothetical protein